MNAIARKQWAFCSTIEFDDFGHELFWSHPDERMLTYRFRHETPRVATKLCVVVSHLVTDRTHKLVQVAKTGWQMADFNTELRTPDESSHPQEADENLTERESTLFSLTVS
jgi:hypothetical protein